VPLGVGHRALLLGPGGGQKDVRAGAGVGFGDDFGDHDEFAALQCVEHAVAFGQADHRIGRHDPDRRPTRPVAKWTLMMLFTLSIPEDDWLMPCENTVTVRGVAANRR
jgi:hypothetical protein